VVVDNARPLAPLPCADAVFNVSGEGKFHFSFFVFYCIFRGEGVYIILTLHAHACTPIRTCIHHSSPLTTRATLYDSSHTPHISLIPRKRKRATTRVFDDEEMNFEVQR
jgi:hypothetical protein